MNKRLVTHFSMILACTTPLIAVASKANRKPACSEADRSDVEALEKTIHEKAQLYQELAEALENSKDNVKDGFIHVGVSAGSFLGSALVWGMAFGLAIQSQVAGGNAVAHRTVMWIAIAGMVGSVGYGIYKTGDTVFLKIPQTFDLKKKLKEAMANLEREKEALAKVRANSGC